MVAPLRAERISTPKYRFDVVLACFRGNADLPRLGFFWLSVLFCVLLRSVFGDCGFLYGRFELFPCGVEGVGCVDDGACYEDLHG